MVRWDVANQVSRLREQPQAAVVSGSSMPSDAHVTCLSEAQQHLHEGGVDPEPLVISLEKCVLRRWVCSNICLDEYRVSSVFCFLWSFVLPCKFC